MPAGRPPAHTCAVEQEWTMKGPEAINNSKMRPGYHSQSSQQWSDTCVGNGITIRNLKRALGTAEEMIIQLKNQNSHQPCSNLDHSALKDQTRGLENKLLESQKTISQRDAAIRNLEIKVMESQQGYTKLNDRLVMMIKQDLWRLPNRINIPELPHSESMTPTVWVDHLAHLLTILEDVRKDIHESEKKDYERHKTHELDGAQVELAELKTKFSELTTQLNKLTSELTIAHGEKTTLQDELNDVQVERLGAAKKHSEVLQNLELEIGDLRKDIMDFQAEKSRLTDEIKDLRTTEDQLRQELARSRENTESKLAEIAQLQAATMSAGERTSAAAQTSPPRNESARNELQSTFDNQVPPLKRPLSPTFGVNSQPQNTSRQSTMEDNQALSQFSEAQLASQASPTPHLDELFVGNRGTTPKVSTLRVTRTRRKAVNPMLDPAPPISDEHQSAPSTPVADAEKRRSKRSKVTKIA